MFTLMPAPRKTLTKAQITLIASAVQAGVPWEACAYKAMVSGHVLKEMVRKGAELNNHVAEHGAFPEGSTKADWMCAELAREVEAAHQKAIEKFARKINSAAAKSWQAAAWWLDRRAKDMFSPRDLAPKKEEGKTVEGEVVEKTVFLLPSNNRGPAQ